MIACLRAAENGIKQDPGKNCLWVASPYGTEFRDGAASLRLHLRKAIPSKHFRLVSFGAEIAGTLSACGQEEFSDRVKRNKSALICGFDFRNMG